MRSLRVLRPLFLLAALGVAVSAPADPAASPKPAKPLRPAQGSLLLHVSYLVIDGETRTAVPLDHKFSTGDRLQIEVTPSRDGHLYLFSREKDGTKERLWPPGDGTLPVRAGQTISVPEHGSFRMEGDTAEDTIDLLFTLNPLADPAAVAGPGPSSSIVQIRLKEVRLDTKPVADPGASFTADLDDRGAAVLELKVRHR
jgi:hypothetical protein